MPDDATCRFRPSFPCLLGEVAWLHGHHLIGSTALHSTKGSTLLVMKSCLWHRKRLEKDDILVDPSLNNYRLETHDWTLPRPLNGTCHITSKGLFIQRAGL